MSALSFDANIIAATIGRWRAELDQHRRAVDDTDATLELDRLLSGFSKVLRGDRPELSIPGLGIAPTVSVISHMGAAADVWRAALAHERGFDNGVDFVPAAATDEASRVLDGLDALLRGERGAAPASTATPTVTALDNAILALGEASSQLYQLSTLFSAIATVPRSDVGDLANLGAYTASDWGNSADCVREQLQGEFGGDQ